MTDTIRNTLAIFPKFFLVFWVILPRQIDLHSFREFAASKQDAVTAALAFEPDIRAEAHHRPFVRTAGMWFA